MIPDSIVHNTELQPLIERDLEALAARWVTPEIAQEAHLRRVTSLYGAEMVGHHGRAGDYSGIVIPYLWPGDNSVREWRLRRDHPDMESGRDGKMRPRKKYLSPPAGGNRLYLAPQTELAQLSDENLPIIIGEGEFKTLALWRLAWHGLGDVAESPAFLPIGLNGVWGFRGVTGKTQDEDGRRADVRGPIPDLSRVVWTERRVVILFDADLKDNVKVQDARGALTRELEERGARVAHFVWPSVVPIEQKGIDDFLAANGPEPVLRLLVRAKSVTKQKRKRTPSVAVAVSGGKSWRDDLICGDKGIKPLLANALTAMRFDEEWNGTISFNEFSQRTEVLEGTPWKPEPYLWADGDDTLLTEWLQREGIEVTVSTAAQAAEAVAREHGYHPVRDYIDRLVWDKVPRTDTWLQTYMGAIDSPYVQAVGSRWLISAVARVMDPGCQADYTLILQGEQRTGKSSALRVLGGDDWFTDDISELGTKDSAIQLLGKWLIELGELTQVVGQRAEMERIKSFLTRRVDHFRPPYGRRAADFPRQCVFAGTTNAETMFRDETGNGRFWPVKCPSAEINVEGLRAVRDQLWAEARARWALKEKWWLHEDNLKQLAEEEQDARYQRDVWDQPVWDYVMRQRDDWKSGGRPVEAFTISKEQILGGALVKKIGEWTRQDGQRIEAIMRVRGLEYKRQRIYDNDGEQLLDPKGKPVREYHFRWPVAPTPPA